MAEKKIEIGGRLHSVAVGNVIAGADEILDENLKKKQSDINAEVADTLTAHERDIANAGKVDNVKVNGIPVVDENKEANINITASVADGDTPGTPSATATMQGGNVNIEFAHIKGTKGDKGDNGDKGDKGDSFQPIEDVSGLVLAHGLGSDDTKAMSQYGITKVLSTDISVVEDFDNQAVSGRIATTLNPHEWRANDSSRHAGGRVIDCVEWRGKMVVIEPQTDSKVTFAFIASPYESGTQVAYAEGSGYTTIDAESTKEVPSDAVQFWYEYANASDSAIKVPQKVTVKQTITEKVSDIEADLQECRNDLPQVVKVKSHEANNVIAEMYLYSENRRIRTSNNNGKLNVTEGLKACLEYNDDYAGSWDVALRFVNDDLELIEDTGYKIGKLEVTVPEGATRVDMYIKKHVLDLITQEEKDALANAFKVFQIPYIESNVGGSVPSLEYMMQCIDEAKGGSGGETQSVSGLRAVKSIAHQGYGGSKDTAIGHNLAESYIKAAAEGFDWGETDVQFSSDGVPMCSHDTYFSANGIRIEIAEHTAEELKSYSYFGNTISTLDEVMAACKSSGLGLILDHTDDAYTTDERLNTVFSIIRKYQMMDRVMWLMYDNGSMELARKITTWYPKSRISRMVNISGTAFVNWGGSNKQTIISQITGWTNTYPQAEVYLSLNYESETPQTLQAAAELFPASVKIAIFTVNNLSRYKELLPFVDAITSDFYTEFD